MSPPYEISPLRHVTTPGISAPSLPSPLKAFPSFFCCDKAPDILYYRLSALTGGDSSTVLLSHYLDKQKVAPTCCISRCCRSESMGRNTKDHPYFSLSVLYEVLPTNSPNFSFVTMNLRRRGVNVKGN